MKTSIRSVLSSSLLVEVNSVSLCDMWLWMLAVTSGVVLLVSFGTGCDYKADRCGAWADGDIQIGMLSSCFSKVEKYSQEKPEKFSCTGFNLASFVRLLSVIHTIETINNSSFLPGVRLGYYICDTCSDASKAIQITQHMLAPNGSLPAQCEVLQKPRIKAIIGARYSEVSLNVARFLSVYLVPQISATSTAEALSDRLRYPAFLRTVPSDAHQTKALAKLMSHFHWDWIGVVHGDDDYGQSALHGFLTDAEKENICTDFVEMLPHNLNNKDIDSRIQAVVDSIEKSRANVVLLILREELVNKLFNEIIKRNITRVWIASDAWSMSLNIAHMEGINNVGDIFGFSFITGSNPGFKEYLQEMSIPPGAENKFIEEYKNMPKDKNNLTDTVDISLAYGDHLAVMSIAHALRKLLECNQTACPGEKDFQPWMLLKELKNIKFTLDNKTFYFDTSGNFINGYDLINWAKSMSNGNRYFVVVGSYMLEQKKVDIVKYIEWNTPNNATPVSICSDVCPPGTARKLDKKPCCHNCTQCLEGTYSNSTNLLSCLPCPNGTWSLKGQQYCSQRTEDFWTWKGKRAIILLTFTLAGYLLLMVNMIIYLVFLKSPVIKQAGGYIFLLIMVGLTLSYTSVLLFIDKPNNNLCRARHALYGLGFSLTVSCILVKAFRTFLAFLPQHRQHRVKKFYKPPAIITCGTFIQVLICTFWFIFDSPVMEKTESSESMMITFQCNEGSGIGFGVMLSYVALLALICFVLAFKGRKVPQRFNETGHIILSMLIYLFVWVCFTSIYVAKIAERYFIQAAAILVSTYAIIFCHFAPKWYMALCKKKDEVTKEAYIARACTFRTSVDSGCSNSSGFGSIMSHNSLHYSPSQISMNSSDSSDVRVEGAIYALDQNYSRSNQSTLRRRFERRSI